MIAVVMVFVAIGSLTTAVGVLWRQLGVDRRRFEHRRQMEQRSKERLWLAVARSNGLANKAELCKQWEIGTDEDEEKELATWIE